MSKIFGIFALQKGRSPSAKTRQISLPETILLEKVFFISPKTLPFCIYRGLGLSLFQVAALVNRVVREKKQKRNTYFLLYFFFFFLNKLFIYIYIIYLLLFILYILSIIIYLLFIINYYIYYVLIYILYYSIYSIIYNKEKK